MTRTLSPREIWYGIEFSDIDYTWHEESYPDGVIPDPTEPPVSDPPQPTTRMPWTVESTWDTPTNHNIQCRYRRGGTLHYFTVNTPSNPALGISNDHGNSSSGGPESFTFSNDAIFDEGPVKCYGNNMSTTTGSHTLTVTDANGQSESMTRELTSKQLWYGVELTETGYTFHEGMYGGDGVGGITPTWWQDSTKPETMPWKIESTWDTASNLNIKCSYKTNGSVQYMTVNMADNPTLGIDNLHMNSMNQGPEGFAFTNSVLFQEDSVKCYVFNGSTTVTSSATLTLTDSAGVSASMTQTLGPKDLWYGIEISDIDYIWHEESFSDGRKPAWW
jgi:hypothetical protein